MKSKFQNFDFGAVKVLSREEAAKVKGGVGEQYWGYILSDTDLGAGCPSDFYCGDGHGWVCHTSSGQNTLVKTESDAVRFVQSHPNVSAWCTPR